MQRLQTAFTQVHQALAALRELTHAMSADVLADEGLAAALEDLVAASAVPTALSVELVQQPPVDVSMAVYAAVAAALDNVAEHARPGSAVVRVSGDGSRLVLRVEDDGRGGAVPGTGLTEVADRSAPSVGRFGSAQLAGQCCGETGRRQLPVARCAR